jgi:hypothetical protein
MMEYVIVDNGDSYRTGKIIDKLGDEHFIIQFDDMSGTTDATPAEMVCIAEMASILPNGFKAWGFFNTREDLRKWIDFLDGPRKPSIVNLVK